MVIIRLLHNIYITKLQLGDIKRETVYDSQHVSATVIRIYSFLSSLPFPCTACPLSYYELFNFQPHKKRRFEFKKKKKNYCS